MAGISKQLWGKKNPCSVGGCERDARTLGLCGGHYNRQWRGRDVGVRLVVTPATTEQLFWQQAVITANTDKCWLWQGCLGSGNYGVVRYKGRQWRTHRLAYFFHTGRVPRLDVLHSCDIPQCVNPNHLREGTDQDNANDKVSRFRHRFGETQRSAKLTNDQAHAAKIALRDKTATQKELCERYGVTDGTMSALATGRTWKWIQI